MKPWKCLGLHLQHFLGFTQALALIPHALVAPFQLVHPLVINAGSHSVLARNFFSHSAVRHRPDRQQHLIHDRSEAMQSSFSHYSALNDRFSPLHPNLCTGNSFGGIKLVRNPQQKLASQPCELMQTLSLLSEGFYNHSLA